MFDPHWIKETDIKIISILPERAGADTVVTFEIGRGGRKFPVTILRQGLADGDLIAIARHHLHGTAQYIADLTLSWKLTDEQFGMLWKPAG